MEEIIHRRFIAHNDAHYAGGIVDGAYVLRLFGEIATDISLQISQDEGLLAGYDKVSFNAPIHAGDIVEATGAIVAAGNRSRKIEFEARVVASGAEQIQNETSGRPGTVVVRATGTLVIPKVTADPVPQN